jgi:hypothetical protein
MVKQLRCTGIAGIVVLIFAPFVCAHQVALRNGTVIEFEKYRVANNELLYVDAIGVERSVQLTDINYARTKELNANENPALNLPLPSLKSTPVKTAPTPLGDVARQVGAKPETEAEGRVFTNDDFPSSPMPRGTTSGGASPSATVKTTAATTVAAGAPSSAPDWAASKAKIELFLSRTQGLTEQEYVARLLGPGLTDIQFPRRAEWQAEIFRAHQRYVADATLCISDRVSDMGRRQNEACSRLDSDKTNVQTMRDQGKGWAQDWKTRQEAASPY